MKLLEGFAVPAPPQWIKFGGGPWSEAKPERIELTEKRWRQLRAAVFWVNRLPYTPDPGKDEWKIAGREGGDCEDLSLALGARLIKKGWPAGTLRLTTCLRGGTGHAVLSICTADEDLIWCCIVKDVVPAYLLSDPSLPSSYSWRARWSGNSWISVRS